MWLAAIQLVSGRRWQDNREQIAAELALLPSERPLLVLLPENFALFGERQGYLDGAETIGPDLSGAAPIQRQLAEWARDYGIWLVAGAMPTTIAGSDHIHTSTLVFDPSGDLKGHYHKIHLFDVDVADNHGRYRESETFSPGEEPVLVDSPFGPLGLSICYDLRFPELYRRLARAGARVLLVPAAFTAVTGEAHWEPLLRARAIENQCYLVAANQGGTHETGRQTWGHSMVIDPWGRVLASLDSGRGTVLAPLDPGLVDELQRTMPVLGHARLL
ncbi:carbon-nitrogen hydrolase family protein [Aeromonas hydrophila]|uniref:carbon-nitrogen hydrolase family protein n=1 Tax=Aeromonas hydrophila TaxID=644 RepID=UPI0029D563C6|nr:carbon-nitrogen hydrolase family protein [Aeromonas hydrophila]MBX9563249.1 carbon-nitrogen hydrolase family protein [Aeromonas hydrophila]MDX7778800.1 carbon-nitrogen hydrolase family protein [Aeromonas hydrophila]